MYNVSDFIIRLKNAARARRREVVLPYSKLNRAIANVLVKQHILESIKEEVVDGKKHLQGVLAYEKRQPVITDVVIISKPSLRVYAGGNQRDNLVGKGLGMTVVTTSQGVMTGRDAFKKGIGGEVLFKIW